MNSEQLEYVKRMIPAIKAAIDMDTTVTILADGIVQYVDHAKSFHMTNEVGSAIPADDPSREVFRTKKEKYYEIPKEVYGVNIHGKFIPLFDLDGELLCVVVTAFSMDREIALEESAETITSSLEETAASVSSYSEEVKALEESVTTLTEVVSLIENGTKEISKLVAEIKGNASKSKILALNASIEAARSGDAGRGFAIVAQQMGVLAGDSNNSSQMIDEAIATMFKQLESITDGIKNVDKAVTTQSTAIDGISKAVEIIANESEAMFALTSRRKND